MKKINSMLQQLFHLNIIEMKELKIEIEIMIIHVSDLLKQNRILKKQINLLCNENRYDLNQLQNNSNNYLIVMIKALYNMINIRDQNPNNTLSSNDDIKIQYQKIASDIFILYKENSKLEIELGNCRYNESGPISVPPSGPPSGPISVPPSVVPPPYWIEQDPDNYGHINIISQLPPGGDFPELPFSGSNQNYYGSDSYNYQNGGSSNLNARPYVPPVNRNLYFNKSQHVLDRFDQLKPINDKDYIDIYRIGVGKSNETVYSDKVLCMSLFISNNINVDGITRRNNKDNKWMNQYVIPFIRQILLVRFYLPDIEIRQYFDHYLLKKFQNFNTDLDYDFNIEVNDYEDHDGNEPLILEKINELKKKISDFKVYIKVELGKKKFHDQLEKFLYIIDKTCRFTGDSNNLGKGPNIFVYQFKDTFLENRNLKSEGVIKNGFLGSLMRYIILRQQKYNNRNGDIINRPKCIFWRDSHTNGMCYNDNILFDKFYTESKKEKKPLYLLPASHGYRPGWNDTIKCDIDDSINIRSAVAGWVQMSNFSNSEKWLEDNNYYASIGIAFLLDNNKKPALIKLGGIDRYKYGIDEYVLSSLFVIDHFKQNSIYLEHTYPGHIIRVNTIYNSNPMKTAYKFLLIYIIKKAMNNGTNKLKENVTLKDVVRELEILRSISKNDLDRNLLDNEEEYECLRLLLGLVPNKYQILGFIHSASSNHILPIPINNGKNMYDGNNLSTTLVDWLEMAKIDGVNVRYDNINDYDLTYDNLKKKKLSCRHLTLLPVTDFCQNRYVFDNNSQLRTKYINEDGNGNLITQEVDCPAENYFSGFYYDNPPTLNIGINRRPHDFRIAIDAIRNNPYKTRLEISDFKIIDKTNVWNEILISQNINNPFNYNDVLIESIKADFNNTLNDLNSKPGIEVSADDKVRAFNALVWKALSISGIHVPPELMKFKVKEIPSNEYDYHKQEEFNKLAIEISKTTDWRNKTVSAITKPRQFIIKKSTSAAAQNIYSIPSLDGNLTTGTLSWLYCPLIFYALDKVSVTFPPQFTDLIKEIIKVTQNKSKVLGMIFPYNKFSDIIDMIRTKIKTLYNINNIQELLKMNNDDSEEWHHIKSEKQDEIFNTDEFSNFAQVLINTYKSFGLEIKQYNGQGGKIRKYNINYI